MGTRGAWGFVHEGREYLTYNHFDSYPDGLGGDLLRWAAGVTSWDSVRNDVTLLRLVDSQDTPTPDELTSYAASLDSRVSSGDDWYALLRGNQGDPAATLAAGVMIEGNTFPVDSLFCEWAYVFDLDAGTFEVYQGFQTSLPTEGRWAGRPTTEEDAEAYEAHVAWCAENDRDPWIPRTSEYKAVQRVGVWPLDALPSMDDLLAVAAEEAEV